MPAGEQIYRVKALTANPTFIDYYRQQGGDYNPDPEDWGFMYETEATAAAIAGDVLVHKENTPITLERLVPRKLGVGVQVPGDGSAVHTVYLEPGIFDGNYTITVTMAIDGGGDLTAVTTAAVAGEKSGNVAGDLAAQTVSGVTIVQDDDFNDVFFAPDAGAFTKFTAVITP